VHKTILEMLQQFAQQYRFSMKDLKWHDWLGGQFWVGRWYFYGCVFSNFFFDICGLRLSDDLMERARAYRQVCESVNYIWPNRDFVMVCARPTHIHRDARGRLHAEHGMAIRYPDGWGLYHLHGVRFSADLYQRVITRSMTMKEILQIQDIDQRTQARHYAKTGYREWFTDEGGSRIDTYDKHDAAGRTTHYELWRIPKGSIFTQDVIFALYDCPTAKARGEAREYCKGVPNVATVREAMSWGMSSEAHPVTPEQWELMEPLAQEA